MQTSINQYVWDLYLRSGGSDTVEFFEKELSPDITEEYAEKIREFQSYYTISNALIEYTQESIKEAINYFSSNEDHDESLENTDETIDDILGEIWDVYAEELGNNVSDKDIFAEAAYNLPYFSTVEAAYGSTDIIPYYFWCNFNVLTIIANAFEIELPPLPQKKEYRSRFFYYGELCKAFNDYREINNWSKSELLAFLYDFAPKYIGGTDSYIIKDLPEPRSAFFIGGGGNNGDEKAEDDPNEIVCWQCNPDTRAGDMIVMYLRTPISSISSVWRSCSIGFNDPFFFYYRCTFIGNPIKGHRIGIDKIKKDKILSKMPVVSKNLQGINGVELKPSEYNHILDITKIKAERLEDAADLGAGEYVNEKAVEDAIIKPLIAKLGYSSYDYETQTRIPVGNHNTLLIPDFVLSPTKKGRYTFAYAIIEAKRSIVKVEELNDALGQARSYALELSVRYAAVASQEGIWITSVEDKYNEVIYHQTWDRLKDADDFMKLRGYLEKR